MAQIKRGNFSKEEVPEPYYQVKDKIAKQIKSLEDKQLGDVSVNLKDAANT